MEQIKQVLSNYQVFPTQIIKITDSLYQVQTTGNIYALKKTSYTKEKAFIFNEVYEIAHSRDLVHMIPVYLTINGNKYIKFNDIFYYLTPWLVSHESNSFNYQAVFQALGKLHQKTIERVIPKHDFIPSLQAYQIACQKAYKKLVSYISKVEKNRYMAPFELQICTHFHLVEQVFQKTDEYLEELTTVMKDKEWSYSLCHGNFQVDHIIQTIDYTYFINWEQARFGHPTTDIGLFLKNASLHYAADSEMLFQAFSFYKEENELYLHELYYLIIFLLEPLAYTQLIERYISYKNKNQLSYVVEAERKFRVCLFGLKWAGYIQNDLEENKQKSESIKSSPDEKP